MNKKIIYITVLSLLLGLAGYSQTYNLNNDTNGSTITTCNATLYDSGGPSGQYSNDESYTITFCGVNNAPIIAELVSMRTESSGTDYIRIYDGPNVGSTLMATIGGSSMPAQTEYEASGNCITIAWHSDYSIVYAGFEISIRCGFPCQDYTVNITPEAEYPWMFGRTCVGCCKLLAQQRKLRADNRKYHILVECIEQCWYSGFRRSWYGRT